MLLQSKWSFFFFLRWGRRCPFGRSAGPLWWRSWLRCSRPPLRDSSTALPGKTPSGCWARSRNAPTPRGCGDTGRARWRTRGIPADQRPAIYSLMSWLRKLVCATMFAHHARGLPCNAVHRPAVCDVLQLLLDDCLHVRRQRRLACDENHRRQRNLQRSKTYECISHWKQNIHQWWLNATSKRQGRTALLTRSSCCSPVEEWLATR